MKLLVLDVWVVSKRKSSKSATWTGKTMSINLKKDGKAYRKISNLLTIIWNQFATVKEWYRRSHKATNRQRSGCLKVIRYEESTLLAHLSLKNSNLSALGLAERLSMKILVSATHHTECRTLHKANLWEWI